MTASRPRHRRHIMTTANQPRRSVRIMQKKPCRFTDLPPELSNSFLEFAVAQEEQPNLVAGLPATAKALSQVSRAIRAEVARIFFSQNLFNITLNYKNWEREGRREAAWVGTWGPLASTHIRQLSINCGGNQCKRILTSPSNHTKPVVYARGLSPSSSCILHTIIKETDLVAVAIAIFRSPRGEHPSVEQADDFLSKFRRIFWESGAVRGSALVSEILLQFQ